MKNLSKQLLYTWNKYFSKILRNVKSTNFIKYSINLKLNNCLFYSKILYYIEKNADFITLSSPK